MPITKTLLITFTTTNNSKIMLLKNESIVNNSKNLSFKNESIVNNSKILSLKHESVIKSKVQKAITTTL